MPRIHLTDDNLKAALKSPENSVAGRSRPLYIWDTALKGFGVRVNPGGQNTFIFKMRIGKKQVWYPLGNALGDGQGETETTTCKDARAQAKVYAGKKEEGIASAPKKKKVVLWGQLLDEFEERHLPTVKPKTKACYLSVLKVHLRPAFSQKTSREVTEKDIADFYTSLAGMPRQANVCLMLLQLIFRRAEGWDYRDPGTNPVTKAKNAGLDLYPKQERDRQFSDEELQKLGQALEAMETEGHLHFCSLIRMLMLSGARLREVMSLQWEQIDENARIIRWKDSKTGKTSKPLNDALFEVIARIPRIEDNPWLFQSTGNRPSESGHIEDIKRPWRQVLHLAGIEDVHRHDLRHLHGNAASELGHNLQTIAALLGHHQTATTERYAKVGKDPRLAASNEVAKTISRKLKGGK